MSATKRRLAPVLRLLAVALVICLAGWYALVALLLHLVVGLSAPDALRQAPVIVGGTVVAATLILMLVIFGLDLTLGSREER